MEIIKSNRSPNSRDDNEIKSEGGTNNNDKIVNSKMKHLRMKKKLLVGLFVLGVPTLVLAAWLFAIEVGVVSTTVSLPGYAAINIDIPSLSVNTTEGPDSDSKSDNVTINRDAVFNVSIIESYQDDSAGECVGGQDDCTMIYQMMNGTDESYTNLKHGDALIVKASRNSRPIKATISCIAYSCPQTRTADITLTEVNTR